MGTIFSKPSAGVDSRSAAPTTPPSAATGMTRHSHGPCPLSSGREPPDRADAVEDQRDGVGHVRRHRRNAHRQQRRVGRHGGQPGDAARQTTGDSRDEQQQQPVRVAHQRAGCGVIARISANSVSEVHNRRLLQLGDLAFESLGEPGGRGGTPGGDVRRREQACRPARTRLSVRRASVILCTSVGPSAMPSDSAATIISDERHLVGDAERAVQVHRPLHDVVQHLRHRRP